ncbi:MAG: UDP-glucose/GDP-mannose dehydrogenase family protein [Deltaproteobacteria bacterium]|nr:UDP-glucose/GDP-mannose dehydrogenase family protein [Deltaproteobacteria bacterium]
MRISIFGLGYVGVVGMACLSRLGHQVVGIDTNEAKVELINSGLSPVIEEDVDVLIADGRRAGNISGTPDVRAAASNTDLSFICVGTPSLNNGHLDHSAVLRVARDLGEAIRHKNTFHVVAVRSTVMPGTNKELTALIADASGKEPHVDFSVVSNPEFLREGSAVHDYFHPPYSLIGSENPRATDVMKQIYRDVEGPVIVTDIGVSELLKYVCNSYHALKVAFANEVGTICKTLNIDSHKLMEVFCLDTKLNISPYYLKPGFAYGGSCLPKDLKALCGIAHDFYLKCPVLESIDTSNEFQKKKVLDQIIEFGKQKIGFLGMSFKAGTDDLRYSPIIDVIEKLLGKGFDVRVYDKNVNLSKLIGSNREFITQRIPLISRFMTGSVEEVLAHSEILVIVNKEDEFNGKLSSLNGDTIIYDLVNIAPRNSSKNGGYHGLAW